MPPASSAALPPRPPATAPARAKTYYKVVAVAPGDGTRFLSIFDGHTEYALDRITAPPQGVWVCPDALSTVRHAARLPTRSALLAAPRAILQVHGWNADGTTSRMEGSDAKCNVSHVLPTAVMPYTAAAQPGGRTMREEAMLADGIGALSSSSSSRPRGAPTPAEMQVPGGRAQRAFGGGEAQAQRMQAATVTLHEEVMLAEARLQRLRAIQLGSFETSSSWVRRALERT